MPFSSEFKAVYEAIRKAIEIAHLTATRADDHSLSNNRSVMKSILEGIIAAEVIVADTTPNSEGKCNPNVYYEIGLAHAVKDNVILVTQDTSSIPLDLQHIPHLLYSLNDLPSLTEQLAQRVKKLPRETGPKPIVRAYFS